jgi:hypothetical protein
VQDFGERWNEDSFPQRKSAQLVDSEVGDSGSSPVAKVTSLDNRIVVYYDGAVTCRVYVELESLGAKLDGVEEGGNRILGKRVVRTPMGDRDRGAGRSSQAWPLVS